MFILSRSAVQDAAHTERAEELVILDQDGYLAFSPNDADDPTTWSRKRRWYITAITLSMVMNCSFASSAPTGALIGIKETFHVSQTAANLVTTLFLLGYCAGPLFWAPLSEYFGRKYIFSVSFTGYFAFNFLCAWAPNFGSLLVGRFLTGTSASSAFSNGPGVIADLWDPIDRGSAMALLIMLTFAGPVIGPITSGFLQLKENWRWTFYELLWLSGATLLFLPTLPETLAAKRLTMKAKRLRKLSPKHENVLSPQEANGASLLVDLRHSLLRPFQLLFDPISFCLCTYNAVVYAILYMMFTIYPIVFQEKRGWNSGVGELPLLALAVGACLASTILIVLSGQVREKTSDKIWQPENRLPLAMIGAIVLPIAIFWLAWTGNYNSVPWIVPTLSGGFLGFAIVLIFVSTIGYTTDAYLPYAASASAINTVLRSATAAGSPLFTSQMFAALGVAGAGSLLGGLTALLAPIPFLFYRYGPALRRRSTWATKPSDTVQSSEKADSYEMSTSGVAITGV